MDILSMYELQMNLNFSLQYLLLLSFRGILKFFFDFLKILFFFYTNDETVQSTKETVTNRISFFYSILMTNRWVILPGGLANFFL